MKVTAGTIARTAVLAVSLLNVLLNAFGKNPCPFRTMKSTPPCQRWWP